MTLPAHDGPCFLDLVAGDALVVKSIHGANLGIVPMAGEAGEVPKLISGHAVECHNLVRLGLGEKSLVQNVLAVLKVVMTGEAVVGHIKMHLMGKEDRWPLLGTCRRRTRRDQHRQHSKKGEYK